jgi:hypothetical protein
MYIESFTEHLNSLDNNIKFTKDVSDWTSLPFLDCEILVQDTGLTNTRVYRKPTHTDQYLAFDSNHPLEHKRSVVRTLIHRVESIVTDERDKREEMRHVKMALKSNNYPEWSLKIRRKTDKNMEKKKRN